MENKAVPVESAASIRRSTPAQEDVATTFDSIDGRAQQGPESLLINIMARGR
jgi:hypothetical protein